MITNEEHERDGLIVVSETKNDKKLLVGPFCISTNTQKAKFDKRIKLKKMLVTNSIMMPVQFSTFVSSYFFPIIKIFVVRYTLRIIKYKPS
jgi:hypothetical protein